MFRRDPFASCGIALLVWLGWSSVYATEFPRQTFTNSVGMVMVRIPAGYWAGQYETTQQEYERVTGANPSQFKAPRNPVERVNWHDAVAFCTKLTESERAAGKLPEGCSYRLPTEKEWVYLMADAKLQDAVRGRFGAKREPLGPREVGSLKPNQLGLHDMLGNVWEWCLDLYLPNYSWRVLRGGAWSVSDPEQFTAGTRLNVDPETAYGFYGFRCVLTSLPP